jgi:predicted negative regulator of RcsB-dependent stress response
MNRERCDVAGRYAALNWLIKAAKQSQNHEVKQALGKLEALLKTQSDEVYTLVNRLSDPKRQEKYERKHNT